MHKERNVNIELIRIFACISVISLHVWRGSGIDLIPVEVKGVIRMFQQHGVPLFFIIMGCYLFGNQERKYFELVKRVLIRVFLPGLIAFLAYSCFFELEDGELRQQFVASFNEIFDSLSRFIAGDIGAIAHLWFIFAYCEIIVLFPLLSVICKNDLKLNRIRRGYILFWIITTVLRNVLYIVNGIFMTEISFVTWGFFNQNIVYVLLGFECRELKSNAKIQKHIEAFSTPIYLCIYFLSNLIICGEEFLIIKLKLQSEYFYHNSVIHIASSLAVFFFAISIRIQNDVLKKIILWIGDKTFYIYIVHYAFALLLPYCGLTEKFWKVPHLVLYCICVMFIFGLSLFISCCIKSVTSFIHSRV